MYAVSEMLRDIDENRRFFSTPPVFGAAVGSESIGI